MDRLNVKIAGEIALSDKPGSTMKKWREIFGITQAELGEFMGISASTISDYEGNRRRSPGIVVVKRFVDALIELDMREGGAVTKRLREETKEDKFFETIDFSQALSATDFAKLIDAKVIANGELLDAKRLYGYTVLDSIKIILEMPYTEFPKLYGASPERAFVFTEVSTGRSPLVVVRVSQIKPSVIVLHGIDKVDKLAVKIAQVEKIPLLLTKIGMDELRERLKKV
ncbi:MAG: helix-turn-helix domain-containing protein [Candidatus ainarchaeum sp.]|nr:helix-turn-helix domain-containing protein [Candidatus ainarchaeum sp.]